MRHRLGLEMAAAAFVRKRKRGSYALNEAYFDEVTTEAPCGRAERFQIALRQLLLEERQRGLRQRDQLRRMAARKVEVHLQKDGRSRLAVWGASTMISARRAEAA